MNTYLIASNTIYNIDKKIKELTNGISNIIYFNMDENSVDELLEEASYFSMFDDKKCIIVKNIKVFGTSKSSDTNKSKEDTEKIIKYLNNENKNTIIIFVVNDKCDSRKKIFNILKDNNNVFVFDNMSKTDIKNELKRIINENNYKIDDNSLWYIINNCLGNIDICINELKKIFLYYDNKPCYIKEDIVKNLISRSIEDNNFKLVDAIIEKNYDESLKLLKDLKTLKVDPNVIIALLYREYRLMLTYLIMNKNKCSDAVMLKEMGLVSWQLDKVKQRSRLFKIDEIKEEMLTLSDLDYKNKSGNINKDLMLYEYILNTCL